MLTRETNTVGNLRSFTELWI